MAHWRDSARRVKIGPLDAVVVFPFLLLLFLPSWKTFWFCILTFVGFGAINIFLRVSLPVAARMLRMLITGKERPALPGERLNRF
jgi:hypothetical protein